MVSLTQPLDVKYFTHSFGCPTSYPAARGSLAKPHANATETCGTVPWPPRDDTTEGAALQHLFQLSLSGGRLVALELLSSARPDPEGASTTDGEDSSRIIGNGLPPFPFAQSQLYSVQLHSQQPVLLLADAGCCIYLWQGWWPAVDGEPLLDGSDCSTKTASALARFALERRLAIQTTVSYTKERRSADPTAASSCQLVYAGHEPDKFIRLFPSWTTSTSAAQCNAQDGKTDAENIEDVIGCKAKCQYSFAELKIRPLPDGVDSLKLETYLSDGEFCELMKMTRDEYSSLPNWKQVNLKKEVGLF